MKKSHYDLARHILGQDFITPEEIAKARGLTYSDKLLRQFKDTLPLEDDLNYCQANGFMLVAGPPQPLNLLEIRGLNPVYFYSKSGGWYANDSHKFSREDKVNPCWLALRKEPVPNSTSKTWDEQSQLLSDKEMEQVPNTPEESWGLTTYKAVRNVYLLPDKYVRTSSLVSDGCRVLVGGFVSDGLDIVYYWGNDRGIGIGVASSLLPAGREVPVK